MIVKDHLFPAANTGLAWLKQDQKLPSYRDVVDSHQAFLKDVFTPGQRVVLFGALAAAIAWYFVDPSRALPIRPRCSTIRSGEHSTFM